MQLVDTILLAVMVLSIVVIAVIFCLMFWLPHKTKNNNDVVRDKQENDIEYIIRVMQNKLDDLPLLTMKDLETVEEEIKNQQSTQIYQIKDMIKEYTQTLNQKIEELKFTNLINNGIPTPNPTQQTKIETTIETTEPESPDSLDEIMRSYKTETKKAPSQSIYFPYAPFGLSDTIYSSEYNNYSLSYFKKDKSDKMYIIKVNDIHVLLLGIRKIGSEEDFKKHGIHVFFNEPNEWKNGKYLHAAKPAKIRLDSNGTVKEILEKGKVDYE